MIVPCKAGPSDHREGAAGARLPAGCCKYGGWPRSGVFQHLTRGPLVRPPCSYTGERSQAKDQLQSESHLDHCVVATEFRVVVKETPSLQSSFSMLDEGVRVRLPSERRPDEEGRPGKPRL